MADRELTDLTDTGKAIATARLLLTQGGNSRQVSPENFLKTFATLPEGVSTDTGDDWVLFYSDTGQEWKKRAMGTFASSGSSGLSLMLYWAAN